MIRILLSILLLVPLSSTWAGDADSTDLDSTGIARRWQVLSTGWNQASSEGYRLSGTIGQTTINRITTDQLTPGFWQPFNMGDPDCCTLRGDINIDGEGPDISDLLFLATYMFQGGLIPYCLGNANINGDELEIPDIADLVHLVTFLFQSGAQLAPCPPAGAP